MIIKVMIIIICSISNNNNNNFIDNIIMIIVVPYPAADRTSRGRRGLPILYQEVQGQVEEQR